MSRESLKEEARRHEQNEEWPKALDLYLQAIDAQDEGEEPDIALHNRVGDLQIRLGDADGAVANYERAIELYIEIELPNNAIAVCRKIIRNDPTRPQPFLRMGQIRAKQGFVVDARQNYLTYAEMMQARGKVDEALSALGEFAELMPQDVDVRVFLAEQLVLRDGPEDAVRYLAEACRVLVKAGEIERARELQERVWEIAPGQPVPSIEPEEEEEEVGMVEAGGLAGFETTTLEVPEPAAAGSEAPPEASPPEDISFADISVGEVDPGGAESEAPEPLAPDPDGLEPVEPEPEAPEEEEAELVAAIPEDDSPLPGFDDPELTLSGPTETPEDDGGETLGELDPSFAGVIDEEGGGTGEEGEGAVDAGFDLPLMSFGEEEAEEEPEEEAMEPAGVSDRLEAAIEEAGGPLEEEKEEVGGPAVEEAVEEAPEPAVADDPAATLRARVEKDPGDAEGWRLLGRALLAAGDEAGASEALEHGHQAFARNGEVREAVGVVRELLEMDPDRIELRQRLVEYAYQSSDEAFLVQSFLELGEALSKSGKRLKAEAVFRQVLSLDPDNPTALQALGKVVEPHPEAPPTAPEPTPAPAAPQGEDYVDLGSLVLDEDEDEEKTTRWVVAAGEPSGDEAADFAKMLSQFKDKVSENLSADDARSHYDLGTAYKEMGLLDEAIEEFQRSLRADPKSLAAFEMLGQCFLDKGEAQAAIRTLERGVKLPIQVEDDLLGVYYFLGKANESIGDSTAARDFYEKIFSLDINFKDVTERLRTLR